MMEHFRKIVASTVNYFAKSSIVDVQQGSKLVSPCNLTVFLLKHLPVIVVFSVEQEDRWKKVCFCETFWKYVFMEMERRLCEQPKQLH